MNSIDRRTHKEDSRHYHSYIEAIEPLRTALAKELARAMPIKRLIFTDGTVQDEYSSEVIGQIAQYDHWIAETTKLFYRRSTDVATGE